MTKIPVMLTIRGEQRYQGQEPEAVELVTELKKLLKTR